jgi:glycosyltransferase involved in cell wall biosynthesis
VRIAMLGVKQLPSASGVEKVVEEVGSRLVARGHDVTVFTRQHLSGGSQEYRGMRLEPTWSIPTKHLDASVNAIAAALLVRGDTDVVHVHTTNFAPAVAISRLRGVPVIVQSHGLDWQRAKWGRGAAAYLRTSDWLSRLWSSRFVVVSETLERAYREHDGEAATCIPNGVASWPDESRDALNSFGLAARPYILFAARLVPEKGCHVLLDAFARLGHDNLQLVVAGDDLYDGDYARALRRHAGPNVHFVGAVLGAPFRALVQHAEIFVLPSELEGLSTGLLEAMAAGRSIVATDLPENREALGNTGVLFPVGDASALKNAIASLVADPAKRSASGASARRRVFARYDWDASTALLEKTYLDAITHPRRVSDPALS